MKTAIIKALETALFVVDMANNTSYVTPYAVRKSLVAALAAMRDAE